VSESNRQTTDPQTVLSSTATVRGTSKFELLKSWYLANLRKAAVSSSVQLTPAALISADKQQIEQLILSGIHHGVRVGKFKWDAEQQLIEASLCLSGAAAVLAFLALSFLVLSGQPSAPVVIAMFLMILVLIGGTVSYLALRKKFLAPLQKIGNAIATGVGHDVDSVEQLVPAVIAVTRAKDEHASGESLIVDAAPVLLWCVTGQLRLAAVNRGSTTLLGYAPEELNGSQLKKFVLSDDHDRLFSAMEAARGGKTISQLDCRVLSKFGKAHDFRWTIDWSESAQSYFLLAEDISDSKRLERARLEFVSTMGHDIKIPLTSVWVALQSLLNEFESDLQTRQKQLVVRAEGNIERLIAMIEELLEFEMTPSGRLPISYGAVSTAELVEESIASIAPQAEVKQIQISDKCVDVVIEADESKLLRVVINLLSNAIKFSPHGSEVLVSALRSGDLFELKVRDKGLGIPVEYKELIFERYERLPSAQEIEGTGLGLSICKAIVESHGGFIGVNAPADGGSEFWFAIPIRAPQS